MQLSHAHQDRRTRSVFLLTVCLICCGAVWPMSQLSADDPDPPPQILRLYCLDCHGNEEAAAGINLQQMTSRVSYAGDFQEWQKVADQLQAGSMPPRDAEQPDPAVRLRLLNGIRSRLREAIQKHKGDPGKVVIRRLTSAEYGYTIRDLTGLDLDIQRDFVSDAVGGAGFTNTGIAQFIQDSTLERYLEAANQVALHLVIGAGPLTFHQDPGQTGFELSAITRIQDIYRSCGFRSAAGEGGEPFGLDKYPRAFYAAWMMQHRGQFGNSPLTPDSIAADVGIERRFVEHIYEVMTQQTPTFPTSEIVRSWSQLPIPNGRSQQQMKSVRKQCDQIAAVMHDWQNRFGANPDAKEEAPVLRADQFDVQRTLAFTMNVNWSQKTHTAQLVLSVDSAVPDRNPDAVIIWRKPEVLFYFDDRPLKDPQPLHGLVTADSATRLNFGTHPGGGNAGPEDFVTVGTSPLRFEMQIPAGAGLAILEVTAELDVDHGEDCIVRCTLAQLEKTDQGMSVSGMLANPEQSSFADWKSGVLDFARQLPQVSQYEPAPSDRDPIPAPVESSYNNPERNHYHTRIKYHRDDRFLVEKMLDDATRIRLDEAWTDLLGSFEFHDAWLLFLADKFQVDLDRRLTADLDNAGISKFPPDVQPFVRQLRHSQDSIQQAFHLAQDQHRHDVAEFASRAWRRPLSDAEKNRLSDFYVSLRADSLDHRSAVRALISRILVSPDFLYRAERVSEQNPSDAASQPLPLTDHEIAGRLSYFLWSSLPDTELRRAADAGELRHPQYLVQQSRRMLRDPRAKRFAAEFFGQWFGFYRFDGYRGIDPDRFPEFSQRLKSSMYGEAIAFFDHIIRNDLPLNEILFADYSFLNAELAAHYGLEAEWQSACGGSQKAFSQAGPVNTSEPKPKASNAGLQAVPAGPVEQEDDFQKVVGLTEHHRGGLLRLGAVLTATSAPMRTSPVKRGDWILRRTLGTPVPPPPADAGSIPADDVLADGLSVRQRLEAHRSDTSCANCHSRIDALGFALEKYDPLGRWRETYRDGTPIDTSGELRDGTRIAGDQELHDYLKQQRPSFHQTLSTKLLSYALGRQEAIGDLPLLDEMTEHLSQDGGITGLVKRIVLSRQFRYHGRVGSASVERSSE